MNAAHIWLKSYLHPRQAMDALAARDTPRPGALYVLARGLMLSLFFYLPFYLLKFQPISPAYLKIFDSPHYFLYAAGFIPLFMLLTWVYLGGASYAILRLLNYRIDFDRLLNISGLISLTIGVVLLCFDWLMVALNLHTSAVFMGVAHLIIADPWSAVLTAIFYKKNFAVPYWLTVVVIVLTRILYLPLALVFVRT